MRDLLVYLVTTRREEYGGDDRIVIDTEVRDGGDEYRITVASAVPGCSIPRSPPTTALGRRAQDESGRRRP